MIAELISLFHQLIALFQDIPGHLALWTAQMGPWIYVLLFVIIFAETGLIVTPFLPGDSLLFAIGALTVDLAGTGKPPLDFWLLGVSLFVAAVIGDALNYSVGRWLGLKLFKNPNSKVFNPAHLARTQKFYEKHGGKTIVLARFLPIIRTYAPFVAGMGRMKYSSFAVYNVVGGAIWVWLFLALGHFFGNLPAVKSRFQYVILGIIVFSAIPAVIEFIRARREAVSVANTVKESQS